MISGTGVLLALVAFLLLAMAAAIVWWINRTPSAYRRSAESKLPLFSVSLTESRYSPVKPQPAIPSARSSNGRSAKPDSANKQGARDAAREDTKGELAGKSSRASTLATAVSAPPAAAVSTPVSATTVTPVAVPDALPATSSAPPSTRTPSGQRPGSASGSNAGLGSVANAGQRSTSPAPSRPPGASAPPVPGKSTDVIEDGVPGRQIEGHLLRFAVPQEGTLQFLPGRLEILNGLDAGREVRFVRAPGPDGLQVTFGRAEGPAYRHVQLREGTVSRSHARMALRDGSWHLTNLSTTNPVVHNEHILSPGEERLLADGDRVEMGEVVFGFRSR